MRKIPTVFLRDPENMKRVTDAVHPDCQWVLDGEGIATHKYDGTCVMRDDDGWWTRREVKPGKTPPAGFKPVQTDENTGKTVGWEPCRNSPYVKYLEEALEESDEWPPGTYELLGPKVQGNPEGHTRHRLQYHALAHQYPAVPRDFEGLRQYLGDFNGEGLVFHHPDGRMAKIKRRDFWD